MAIDSEITASFGNISTSKSAVYTFTPAGFTTKLALVLPMLVVGVVGFIGNVLVVSFVSWKEKTLSRIERSRFVKTFNLFVRSLAISDILSTSVSLPLTCIQICFDVFQTDWTCKAVRFVNIVFPIITIHNLIVISIEKYVSLRRVPRPLSSSTVRRSIFLAWFLGCISTLSAAATFRGIRYDLNETHFTVICKYDKEYFPFRLIFLSFTAIEYIFPCIFLMIINISLIKTVWVTVKTRVSIDLNYPMRSKLRAAKIRGTLLLIVITFAFIIPYFFYFGYVAYNMIAKPDITFQTDYIIRYGSGVIAFANSAINFLIYVVQMRDFKVFFQKRFFGGNTAADKNVSVLQQMQSFNKMHNLRPRNELHVCVTEIPVTSVGKK